MSYTPPAGDAITFQQTGLSYTPPAGDAVDFQQPNTVIVAPASDISTGAWTPSSGSDLYAMLDEASASDADYIQATSASTCEIGFAEGGSGNILGAKLRYRLPPGDGNITVQLRQGASLVESWGPHALSASYQDFIATVTVTTSDASDLRVRLVSS